MKNLSVLHKLSLRRKSEIQPGERNYNISRSFLYFVHSEFGLCLFLSELLMVLTNKLQGFDIFMFPFEICWEYTPSLDLHQPCQEEFSVEFLLKSLFFFPFRYWLHSTARVRNLPTPAIVYSIVILVHSWGLQII